MADVHHTRIPDSKAGIDTLGWIFLGFASAIIVAAVVIAYQGSDTKLPASASVPHLVAR